MFVYPLWSFCVSRNLFQTPQNFIIISQLDRCLCIKVNRFMKLQEKLMPMFIVLFRHHLTILSKNFFVLSNKDDYCSFFIANVLLLFRMIFLFFFFCTIHEKLMKNSQLEFFSFFLTTLTLPSESHYFTRLVIVNFRRLDHPSPFEKATYLEMEL